jgi:hypothetical protein
MSRFASVAIGGAIVGLAFAASPVTVLFALGTIVLFRFAARDLAGRHRSVVVGLLAFAVAVRVLLVAGLFLATDHHQAVSFFWDGDGMYLKQRSLWIRNIWMHIPVTDFAFVSAFDRLYGWTTYLNITAYIQYWLGPAPYGLHLVNVLFFLTAGVVLFRLARTAFGDLTATVGFALFLFLPTMLAWSVAGLKESFVLLLDAAALASLVHLVRGPDMRTRMVALGLLTVCVAGIDGVRVGAQIILVGGLTAGMLGSIAVRRVSLVLLAVVVIPFAAYRALQAPTVHARVMAELGRAAVTHMGNVRTEGNHYKTLDQRLYNKGVAPDQLRPMEAARFAIRAVVSYLVVPLPWQLRSWSELATLPQQVVWYIMLLLAGVGAVAGLRRDALVTCLLLGLCVVGSLAIALNSGNIGTLVRHRDMMVPFILWLSALGAIATVAAIIPSSPLSRVSVSCQ